MSLPSGGGEKERGGGGSWEGEEKTGDISLRGEAGVDREVPERLQESRRETN